MPFLFLIGPNCEYKNGHVQIGTRIMWPHWRVESGSMSFVALWFLTYVQTCIFALFVHIHNYTYVYAYTFMYIHNVQYIITHLSYIYVYIHMFII
jgi:hypothetical protein